MQKIRNIAIIAHVDHGKTTLVDKILHACHLFRENQETGELILDNNDLERERGITITSKNVSVTYKGVKINIIDTPGHSDFGGEVERVLKMADGVLLLVDAFEGTMPQTRFVTQKALSLGLKPIVVINKVDKPNCRPLEVQDQVFELFFNLGATDEQLDFVTIFGSGKNGWMTTNLNIASSDMTPLLDAIIKHIPTPKSIEGPLQMQITSLDYNSYVGRIAIGRVHRGTVSEGMRVTLVGKDKPHKQAKIKEVYSFSGLGREKVKEVFSGDICALVGLDDFEIGDTVTDPETVEALPDIHIDEPTMSMLFTINTSPFFGKEGKYVTSRHLGERLKRETEKNLALKVQNTDTTDKFNVYGRGILHLAILIETMRREGYELAVGQPQVIIKEIDGVKCEPIELLIVDAPPEVSGKVIEIISNRKGELKAIEEKGDLQHVEFEIPSRGIAGLRNLLHTVTCGEAIMAHRFKEFAPYKGDMPKRLQGVLVSIETGMATSYAIDKLQDRGRFFVEPFEQVYEGQIVGENTRDNDIGVNVTKAKQMTNIRTTSKDEAVNIPPAVKFSLEEALEYIAADEMVEITPKSIRMRKILLKEIDRKRQQR